MRALKTVSRPPPVPQSQPMTGMVANNAGGYSFPVDDWLRLDRFLLVGHEGGTYYVSAQKLAAENALAVGRCIAADGPRVVRRIVELSTSGRAARNDAALFALAMAAKRGNDATRRAAYLAVNAVARTGTHLFHFVEFADGFGGWGRGLRNAVARWYTERPADALTYQVIKYRQRDGWSHRDLLRLAHPATGLPAHAAILHYLAKGWDAIGPEPHPDPALAPLWAFEKLQQTTTSAAAAALITAYNLPREAVPSELLNSAPVWRALLAQMPLEALMRNLATMTRVGLFDDPLSRQQVVDRLSDGERLRRARLHPIKLLAALKTYASGHGVRGGNSWMPVTPIVDALSKAFGESFSQVEGTGKQLLYGLDLSGSMAHTDVNGLPNLSCREACSAIALAAAMSEANPVFLGFDRQEYALPISRTQRFDDVLRLVSSTGGGGTDCAIPMRVATKLHLMVDAFVILTDAETWAGRMHPVVALAEYRTQVNPHARLINVAMTANHVSIGDAQDAGVMETVGFDSAIPEIIRDFVMQEGVE